MLKGQPRGNSLILLFCLSDRSDSTRHCWACKVHAVPPNLTLMFFNPSWEYPTFDPWDCRIALIGLKWKKDKTHDFLNNKNQVSVFQAVSDKWINSNILPVLLLKPAWEVQSDINKQASFTIIFFYSSDNKKRVNWWLEWLVIKLIRIVNRRCWNFINLRVFMVIIESPLHCFLSREEIIGWETFVVYLHIIVLVHIYTLRRRQSCKGIRGIGHPLSKMGLLIIACTIIFSQQYRDTTILNSILYSLKTPDHWYMRYNIIIYKLQWFTGEGHKKGDAKYNKCRMRKINTKYIQMSWKKIVRKNRHCLGFFK